MMTPYSYVSPCVVAVDFDGTVVDHCYPQIGATVPSSLKTIKDMIRLGYKIILYTMRSDAKLFEAVEWYRINGIELYAAQKHPTQSEWTNSNKCYADLYIDDAAFGAPLIKVEGFRRLCIDWVVVRKALNIDERLKGLKP